MPPTAPRVLVELPPAGVAPDATVLAAALTLFGPAVEIALVLAGADHVDADDAARVLAACTDAVEGAPLPTIDLLTPCDAADLPHLAAVAAHGGPTAVARAVTALAGAAGALRTARGGAARSHAPDPDRRAMATARADLLGRAAARDLSRRQAGPVRPLVVAVAQVQSCWAALESVVTALAADQRIEVAVVALESDHELRGQTTADFLRGRGIEPRDDRWFAAQLADEAGPLSLVLLDNPYDALRPEPLRTATIAAAGVRLAYSPYGNNVGAGGEIAGMQYDRSLHRMAWRVYARSEVQRGMYARHCAVGDDHVRVLGMPKLDRVLRPPVGPDPAVLSAAAGRPVVLWNPHFSAGETGWSTFERHLEPMLAWFAAHDDVVLLLRPHFRIFRDLREAAGGAMHAVEARLRDLAARRRNILLDDGEDYLPAFLASDAMVSDLSSLITEYLPTGKPVLYLHKEDGPGVNDDAQYFFALDVATRWDHVSAFLDQVRAGVDGGRGRREVLLQRHFTHLDAHSGERIAADLVDGLLAEGAATPTAQPLVGAR